MKKLTGFLLCAVIFIAAQAQQIVIKDKNAQTRSVSSFHAIEVSNAIDLYLNQSSEEAVAVSASDEKDIQHIETKVENGVLIIRFVNVGRISWNLGNKKIKAYVSFKMIDRLSASGSSDVYVDGAISGDKLSIHLSGSSDFKGAVKLNELSVEQSGSSDAYLSGTAGNISIRASGASDLKGYDLAVDNCTAHASGSSDIKITVRQSLSAEASGSSDIYYKGSAVLKDLRSSGSSNVSRKD